MSEVQPNNHFESTKSQSRGIGCDMSSDAILRRLAIVDELRELAKELQTAKRMGTVDSNKASEFIQPHCEKHSVARQ